MTYSDLTTKRYTSPLKNIRWGSGIDTFLVHHQAGTNSESVRNEMLSPSGGVSANYIITNEGEIWGIVPEEFRAFTSGSPTDGGKGADWDARSITVEIENQSAGPNWDISRKAIAAAAALYNDLRERYGLTRILGHRDLWANYGASYPTYCPGPDTVDRIKKASREVPVEPETEEEEEPMKAIYYVANAKMYWALYHPVSGFFSKSSAAEKSAYPERVAKDAGAGSLSKVTEATFKRIEKACTSVRKGA